LTATGAERYLQPRGSTVRYAIVGGTGMIGTRLAAVLRGRGDRVWILTRKSPRGADELQWDPNRGIPQVATLEGLDAVFNLVGESLAERPWTRGRRRLLLDSRIGATATLIDALAELDKPPAAFIGVSSLGIFGDRGDDVIDDDDPPGTGFLAELCVAWEQAHLAAEHMGSRTALLRMSVVLSPTGGAFPLMVRPFRYLGGWLGNGRQYAPWISIRDCVGALIHLADNPACSGVFNGSIPKPTRNKKWLQALGRVMRVPVVTHAPKWALRGALGELADALFLASIRAVPRKLTECDYPFVDTDAEETFRWLLEAHDAG